MKNRNLDHSDNWATPPELFDVLNAEFNFDFDPCPWNDGEIPVGKNGLLIDWGFSNFVNPPYSKNLKEAFVKRAIEFQQKGKSSVMLLPVSTSTALFHDFVKPNATEIRYLKGRVKFLRKNEKGEFYRPRNGGMHDSMIVVFKAAPTQHVRTR